MAISPRVCLSNSFKIFQGHPSGLLRAKYLTFLCKKVRYLTFPCEAASTLWCTGLLCPGLSHLTKTDYFKEYTQNYQGIFSITIVLWVLALHVFAEALNLDLWPCKFRFRKEHELGCADNSSILLHNPCATEIQPSPLSYLHTTHTWSCYLFRFIVFMLSLTVTHI